MPMRKRLKHAYLGCTHNSDVLEILPAAVLRRELRFRQESGHRRILCRPWLCSLYASRDLQVWAMRVCLCTRKLFFYTARGVECHGVKNWVVGSFENVTARVLWVLVRVGLGFRCNDSRFANVLDMSKILELCLEELEKEFHQFFMEKQRDASGLAGACLLLGLSSQTCERLLLDKPAKDCCSKDCCWKDCCSLSMLLMHMRICRGWRMAKSEGFVT
jgi:hypothetical protein